MSLKRAFFVSTAAGLLLIPLFGVGPSFTPDGTFHGSSLAGWHPVGQADWRADNGEIVGAVKPGGEGGWLVFDRSYQDIGVYASFRAAAGAKTGVLLRAEKTPDGMKGVFLSLDNADVASYRVTLDPNGKILTKDKLPYAGGQVRIAPPPDPSAPARGGRRGGPGRFPAAPAGFTPPISPPTRGLVPGDWNRAEILLDVNIIRAFLNDSGETAGGVADDDAGRFGPFALYVGGSGEVRFKDLAYKDLAVKTLPTEEVSSRFRMQRINDFHYSWSAAAADFNRDGVLDIVAGPYIYWGPDYTTSREI